MVCSIIQVAQIELNWKNGNLELLMGGQVSIMKTPEKETSILVYLVNLLKQTRHVLYENKQIPILYGFAL